jgi:hypothetical protein
MTVATYNAMRTAGAQRHGIPVPRSCIQRTSRNLHIRIFICKRGAEISPLQDWLDINCGVSLYMHGLATSKGEGAYGALVRCERPLLEQAAEA